MDNRLSAAVIGSGFGGIAAAIRLQAQGIDTTLFEKRDQLGGRAYVYKDSGFTFDAGPTVITAPHCLEELFELTDKKLSDYVELLPVDPFYRLCWDDGYHFNYNGDLELTLQQIRARSPNDAESYLKFLEYSREVFEAGYKELVHAPFIDFKSMIHAAPDLLRLKAYRSVYDRVSHFIQDPKLREAFSFHSLLVGGNPFETSSIYTLIHYLERKWGVFFPKGGTGALISALAKHFEELGGKILRNTPVDEIIVREKKVSALKVNGEILKFDLVVSNADVMHTYSTLLRSEDRGQKVAKSLMKKRWSMSLFLIYFGTKRTYPDLAHHTVLFGPRYRGLLEDIFHNGVLAEDMSLYLHAPTRTDPGLAPSGHENFYVLSPVPHLGHSEKRDEIDWKKAGPIYADRILNRLETTLLPGLRNEIVTQRIFTPEDFRNELNAHWGSAFSLEPILTQSAYFRTHNKDSKIRGLYFVGAGTHPGAGVPGVINSAKATSNLIQKDIKSGIFGTESLSMPFKLAENHTL
jgi:phytoene desaturase